MSQIIGADGAARSKMTQLKFRAASPLVIPSEVEESLVIEQEEMSRLTLDMTKK